ncbi:acyl carrier protein [Streptomyces sp. NBC_00257]|uniref:acyl carrier protein n=1 Tax=unclassified Streptomyces TaxID=2593676 RepID=UPI00224CF1EE|nr:MULTISPECIES: acyl carrier protein [unclassified Streptomyces]WTB58818.1 acyl carrier protein [Streptomyces sp. NBC_00826]WTH88305.1 acyl carrier protein [Streptomyces sp. NBC_00825]WTH97033.1 acyl carrier protein [Streptomyces sp. NBC_00822]MCX4862522.1 acyl carrier protein [Streptomyces sp. NBC_00906]MCX4893759.1 acyl carrier protein [Streptomyces sp. NBC_00892]
MKPLDSTAALAVLKESITRIVPDADFTRVGPDDMFRDVLELDSLDFLSLVELLSERTGVRIDEEDYPELTTLSAATRFLVTRSKDSTSSAR